MQQCPQSLPPNLIYSYDQKTNQSWNMKQYKIPRQYLDPTLQQKRRQWAAIKKGGKNLMHVTKKGSFMDPIINLGKAIPASNQYQDNKPWSFEKEKIISKNRKIDKNLKKNTYTEQIQSEQKMHKKPGVGKYSLQKTLKEKKAEIMKMKTKKIFEGERHLYHDNIHFLAAKVPGAGAHNPHNEVNKVRLNKTDYKDWVKKHSLSSERSLKRQKKKPAPGTYSPLNVNCRTFDFIEKKENKKNQKVKIFGSDARFQYTRPNKKRILEKRPDAITYHTSYEWKKNKSHIPWNEQISKSNRTISVYH